MTIFLLQRAGQTHPWTGGLVIGALVCAIGGIAWAIKAYLSSRARAREADMETLGRELSLALRHYRPDEKPTLRHEESPGASLRTTGSASHLYGESEELKMPLDGWKNLFSYSDCCIPADHSSCYLKGKIQDQNVLVSDIQMLYRSDQLDIMFRRSETGVFFYSSPRSDVTGVILYWDKAEFPRISMEPRRNREPCGIMADGFLGSASFNVQFYVTGADEERIVRMLNRDFTDWYKAHPKYSLEFFESACILYLRGSFMSLGEMREAVHAAVLLGNSLQD